MKYETQRVAYPFFAVAMALFALQILFGILAATVYIMPEFLSEAMPFHIMRMSHTNLLVVWLLMGFMGCTYYLMPEEAEQEIHSPMIAYVQLAIFAVAGAGALLSYQFGIHEGREFLEQPLWSKILITVSFLMFLYNTSITLYKGRKTAINLVLMLGLWLAAVFWLFAFFNPSNLAVDKLYWWWVVHLWVEGVWELIMASLLAYLLIKMTGVDREVIEKWLYVIIGLALFSGLLGTGHHYYWIGAPGYWQPLSSIFSTLEVLPFFAMVMFAFFMFWKGRRNHPNNTGFLWRWRVGLYAHAFVYQLLYSRDAGYGGTRSPGILWRVCDDDPGSDNVRHAAVAQSATLQPDPEYVEFLVDEFGHVLHDLHADLCRCGADALAASDGHELHGSTGPVAVVLLHAPGCGSCCSDRSSRLLHLDIRASEGAGLGCG